MTPLFPSSMNLPPKAWLPGQNWLPGSRRIGRAAPKMLPITHMQSAMRIQA